MRKSFDADGVQHAWDATSLTLASECLRKYYYSMIANLQPKVPSVHLIFGGAYAKALERFYKLRAEGKGKEEALREIVHSALIDTYEYEEPFTYMMNPLHAETADGNPPKPKGPVPFLDSRKSRFTLIRSIVWYVDEFGDESPEGIQTHHLSDGSAAVELSFAVELSPEILYTGHMDRVVSYGGSLYWMDQKTTGGQLGSYYFDGFKPHNQFMGYTFAGKIILQSPVAGGVIDAAQIAVGFTRFERHFITFTEPQIEEWRDQALHHISLAREASRQRRFPMNLSACGNYGGCPFRVLCARSPTVRERFLHGDFVERSEPWDPLTPR